MKSILRWWWIYKRWNARDEIEGVVDNKDRDISWSQYWDDDEYQYTRDEMEGVVNNKDRGIFHEVNIEMVMNIQEMKWKRWNRRCTW